MTTVNHTDLHTQVKQLTQALAQERVARLHAEKCLEDSIAYNQRLRDLSPNSMLMLRDKIIVSENRTARQFLGKNPERSLVGESFLNYVHPADKPCVERLLEQLQEKDGASAIEEVRLKPRQDEIRITQIKMTSITKAGQAEIFLIIQDETQARRIERALRENEQRYRQLLSLMPDGVAVHKNGRIVYVNEEALRILKLNSPTEILGKSALDFVHVDDRATVLERIQEILQTGKSTTFVEERFRRLDGSYVTVEVAGFPFTEKGQVAIEVVFRDISHRKKMLAELQKSEERFRTLAETTNAAIFLFNKEELFYVNPAAVTITGYSLAEMRHMSSWKIVHPDHHQSFREQIQALLRGEEIIQHDQIKILTKQGEVRWLDYKGSLIETGGENIVLGTGFDITDLIETQKRMEQYTRRLEALREIDAAGLTSHTLEDLSLVAFKQLATLMTTDCISIFLLDHKTKTAQMIGEHNCSRSASVPKGVFRLSIPQEMYAERMKEIPFAIHDIEEILEISPVFIKLHHKGISSFISVPLLVQGKHLGSLNIGSREPHAFSDTHVQIAKEVAGRLAIALQNVRLYNELKESHAQLEALSYRLVQVQEEERRHIARDLHDEVGQALTGLKLILDRMDTEPGSAVQSDVAEAQELVTNLMDQVRELYLDLRPPLLDDLGLLPTLLWYFEHYSQRTTLHVYFSHNGLNRRFGNEIETTAYRIIQEALTNIARYARAKHVDVMVWADEETIELQIRDDGVGFDKSILKNKPNSSGIAGMRERIKHLGGNFKIEAAPDQGVEIIAMLPLIPDHAV